MTRVESESNVAIGRSLHDDGEFISLYRRVEPFTMVDLQRLHSLYDTVRYVIRAGVPGDLVECGVYRGGCCMLMALTLDALGETDRRIYLYDTFAGMARPGEHDVSADGRKVAREIWDGHQQGDHNAWCPSSRGSTSAE